MANKLKIVVPTNFSSKSAMALDFALRYSKDFDAEVYLFHVLETKEKNFRELDRANVELLERMKVVVMQAIERLHAVGVAHTVDQVHRRISNGKPSEELLEIASGIRADMIVMGAPSSTQFKNVLTKTPCTLVVVKAKDTEA